MKKVKGLVVSLAICALLVGSVGALVNTITNNDGNNPIVNAEIMPLQDSNPWHG